MNSAENQTHSDSVVINIGPGFHSNVRGLQAQNYNVSNVFEMAFNSMFYLFTLLFPFYGSFASWGTAFGATSYTGSFLSGVLALTGVAVPLYNLADAVKRALNSLSFATLARNITWVLDSITEPFWSEETRKRKEKERDRMNEAFEEMRDRNDKNNNSNSNSTTSENQQGIQPKCTSLIGGTLLVALAVFAYTETLNTNIMKVNGTFNLVLLLLVVSTGTIIQYYMGEGCPEESACFTLLITWIICAAVYKSTTMLSLLTGKRTRNYTTVFPLLLFITQSAFIMFLYYGACVSEQIPDTDTDFKGVLTRENVNPATPVVLYILLGAVLFTLFGTTFLLYFLPVYSLL